MYICEEAWWRTRLDEERKGGRSSIRKGGNFQSEGIIVEDRDRPRCRRDLTMKLPSPAHSRGSWVHSLRHPTCFWRRYIDDTSTYSARHHLLSCLSLMDRPATRHNVYKSYKTRNSNHQTISFLFFPFSSLSFTILLCSYLFSIKCEKEELNDITIYEYTCSSNINND